MSTSAMPANTIIRTQQYSLLVLKDGGIRTLRDGDKTWSKKGQRQEMPVWASLDEFLAAVKPAWWTAEFNYPKDWFADTVVQYTERRQALLRERNFEASQKIWAETYGARRQAFLDEVVSPVCAKYNLLRTVDYDDGEMVFGTLGSPAARTAEEQMLEIEPDRTKWVERSWSSGSDRRISHHFSKLYYRNERYQAKKRAGTAAAPVVPPLPLASISIAPPPPAALLAPRAPATKVNISRQQLDLILATGIKKVPDALWEQLTSC